MYLASGFATINFMNLEYVSQQELRRLIKSVFDKHLQTGNYRLFFFGSRVKGNNSPRSDIDLGIESPQALSVKTKLSIEEELQNLPILYKIDLVDFAGVSQSFRQKAFKNIEEIN